MKKLQLLLLILLACPIGMQANLRDSLVSNYGNWMNLTDGFTSDHSYNNQKIEVAIDGNTIHLLWVEFNKRGEKQYGFWYRRSTDLGKTWEDAKLITTVRTEENISGYGAAKRIMAAGNGRVHIALTDNVTWDTKDTQGMSRILYIRSDDGGSSFTTKKLGNFKSEYDSYRGAPQIACDGSFVVIGAQKANEFYYYTSKDGGNSFSEQIQKVESRDTPGFTDLVASNGRWASMIWVGYWYSGLRTGDITITSSDGNSMTEKHIAPICTYGDNQVPFSIPNVMYGGNGDSYNYHPQMVMNGNTIHVMYQGNPGLEAVTGGWNYDFTLYQKSTDGGLTWSTATYLPESKGGMGMIAAKGQNVYILTTRGNNHTLYYSNDGGSTWKYQPQGIVTSRDADRYNPRRDYWITIDPIDATGNHAILTGNRYFYAETKDGFKSLNKNFVLGSESWIGTTYGNNHALRVLLDQNGLEHWFMQYNDFTTIKNNGGFYLEYEKSSSRDILYRRNEAEPAPSSKNMALNLTDSMQPTHRVAVPMSQSINLKEAMTVEFWVRPDVFGSYQLVSTTESDSHNGSIYSGGWFIKMQKGSYDNFTSFSAGICTEKEVDGVGVQYTENNTYRIYKQKRWHHVALTYDSKQEKDNFRIYIDGMLVGAKTTQGDILQGNNPITFGRMDTYDKCIGLIDNFAVWSRALTRDEIRDHIYNTPDGKDKDCRVLLTFDGTLKDLSNYGNDAIALLDAELTEHGGIRPPKADFETAKDLTGRNISMIDKTTDGEAVWWHLYQKDAYYKHTTDTVRNMQFKNLSDGTHTLDMVACNDNAYTAITKTVSIGGLTKVEPSKASQSEGVRLKIHGNYTLDYWTQTKVILHGASGDIQGKWPFEYGDRYTPSDLENADQLAQAIFDLSKAEVGKYDLILGNDTLKQAFEVVAGGQADVWMQINGWDKSLFNKWKNFSIDYGNRSDVPAYNVPICLFISDNDGMVDVSFDFDFDLCNIALSDFGLKVSKTLGDYSMIADENGDSIRCYSFLIPYIGPNSTYHKTFRMRHRSNENGAGGDNVRMYYFIDQPWGAYNPDAQNPYTTRTRAISFSQVECMADYLLTGLFETGIGQVPVLGCLYSVGKTSYQLVSDKENRWTTLFNNTISTVFSCGEDVLGTAFPPALIFKAGWFMASQAWNIISNYQSAKSCMNGDPNNKSVKGVGSYDPNEMIGPSGYDEQAHYIKPIHNMAYTITYENKSTATAPAHEVYINDKLDTSKYNFSTFGFTSFGWANKRWNVGGSYTKEFTRDINFNANGKDIIVRVSGKFDEKTGNANWSMISLDKNGKEIDDPDLGFLVPNNSEQDGEGFVSFSIEHKPNPANNSTISNKATIVFDANAPIETNTFVNTFDTDYPTSKVTKAERSGNDIVISFEGSDATSGIASYDLYVFKNGRVELLAAGVTGNQYTMKDAPVNYSFCSIATDHVGWKEPKNLAPEATGIRIAEADTEGDAWTVYSVDGKVVAQGKGKLPKMHAGAYVVRSGNSTKKIIIQ